MAIFGTGQPKIISAADETINLDYAKILVDEPEFDNVIHQSKIDGARTFLNKGYHWRYEVLIHLVRYGDPTDKYNALNGVLHTNVTLYRHRDNDPVKTPVGSICPFNFAELRPIYLTDSYYKDALHLVFLSTEFVDISQSTTRLLATELDRTLITTEAGLEIIIG